MSPANALIGAILVLGGVGYAVDWWLGTSPWFMLVGLTLMLLMIFRPQGIFGDRKEIALDAR